MAAGCVSNWGNDNNAGTVVGAEPTEAEWKNAKRSLQGASDVGFKPIYAIGFLNENITGNTFQELIVV